jgi:aryl-alcohol dehydrogenase-like predicted oxidoreductase
VEESLGAIKKAQEAGKIRHVGLSEVTPEEIDRAKKVVPIVSIQNEYNIAYRKSDKALAYCEQNKLGFIPWSPIGGSGHHSLGNNSRLEEEAKKHNATVVQLALAWLLYKSPVMLPIPGTSNPAHLEENMAAAKIQMSTNEWKKIDALFA